MSSTIAVDASISEDNKYVGIAEVNTSGTLIQSNIKILSIAKAKENPTEAIVYTYNAPLNSLVLNIKYQNKNKLVCEYDNEIHVIKDNVDTKLTDINTDQEKITYYSIELDNNIVKNVKAISGGYSIEEKDYSKINEYEEKLKLIQQELMEMVLVKMYNPMNCLLHLKNKTN